MFVLHIPFAAGRVIPPHVTYLERFLTVYPWGGSEGCVHPQCYPFLDCSWMSIEAEHKKLHVEKLHYLQTQDNKTRKVEDVE